MKKLSILLMLLFIFLSSFAHPWKPSHYVVIDTDAGIDDMRAISMLLASDDVKILGIIISGGALSPYDGYKKVKSMLNAYHHEGIPIAMDYNIRGQDKPVPLSVTWGVEEGLRVPETNGFNKLCKNILKYESGTFKIVALASLNSAAELIDGGVLPTERLSEIVWSNNSLKKLSGFNAAVDIRSANKILKSDVRLTVVGYSSDKNFYNDEFVNSIRKVETRYAEKIYSTIASNPDLANHEFALSASDEMTAIYLHYPELFNETLVKENAFYKPIADADIKGCALDILKGGPDRGHQVFKHIPVDTSFYQPDLQGFINEIVTAHGQEEWEACLFTNEIHQHLGIYSIIGAKMGIRAREYFNVGVDQMEVISSAGSEPPLSCLNDGIQVSTGATTGHGLLEIRDTESAPSVQFKHNGNSITIKLKDDLFKKISEELKDLVIVNGLDNNIYWELVRQRAILYWKNLNRYEIFEIITP